MVTRFSLTFVYFPEFLLTYTLYHICTKIMYGPCWAGRTQTKKRLEVILQWTIAAISVLARTVSFL